MTDSSTHDTNGEVQGSTTRHSSEDGTGDSRELKARLFGDETGDRLHKQVIKARFLRNLRQPTGGTDTRESDEAATEPSIADLPATPVRIDRYAVLRKLGQGGMGVVYVAYDENLDRKVALKLLRGNLSKDERGRARMLREAQALARLSHPNVVQVHEIGQYNDHVYVAMEYVDGQTLDRWLAAKDRSWREVLEVLTEAGRGLEAAHAAGLVHRDFKPANLLIGRDGRARVLDFGLARSVHEQPSNPGVSPIADIVETAEHRVLEESRSQDELAGHSTSAFNKMLTVTGALLGTPAYMAPEQHLGQPADALSDQFSFCVVLYESLFHQRPFRGGSRTEYAMRVTEGEFEAPPVNSGVPVWLRKVVLRGLSPKAGDRWPSMTELLAELRRDRTRNWRGAAVALGLLGVFGVALSVSGGDAKVCAADPGSVEDSWGDTQLEAVRAAFDKTGMPEATAVLEHTRRSLDAYAEELVAARMDACEARWVARSQTDAQLELRSACLEQREGELAAVVGLLADADRAVVLHAPELIAELGDVGLCERVALLEVGTPAPKDADAVAGIAEVRELIAEAHATRDVGRITEAKALTAKAWRVAKPLGFEPLLGELHNLEGRNARFERDFEQSRNHITEAVAIAERTRSYALAADAWINLAFLTAQLGANPAESLEFKLADAAVDKLSASTRWRAELALARGVALREAGRHPDAVLSFDEALALAETGFIGNEYLISNILVARSGALVWLGRTAEARADLERVLSTRGVLNQVQLDALFELAMVESRKGDLDRAEEDMKAVLAGYESLFGPRFPFVGHAYLALAQISLTKGAVGAAERYVGKALAIFDDEHSDRDWALDALAEVQLSREEFDAAERTLRLAIAHRERVNDGDRARLAYLHGRLGLAQKHNGKLGPAIESLDYAISQLRGAEIDAPLNLCELLLRRGQVRLEQGEPHLALNSLEQALELVPRDSGDARLAGQVRVTLAETFHELGIRTEEQRQLAIEAIDLLQKFPTSAKTLALARELSETDAAPFETRTQ